MSGTLSSGNANVSGSLSVSNGATVDVLHITGGADIAEPFQSLTGEAIEPGMVVEIDPGTGKVVQSSAAYSKTVVGIVSGANGVRAGLTLSKDGSEVDGNVPVALTGRVWCWCDADANGPIKPGTMLTSSKTEGHAMTAKNPRESFGATVGKALTTLDRGRGLVLVLVTIQ